MKLTLIVVTVLALAACSDPGNRPPGAKAPDQKSWQAPQNGFVAPGWNANEQSWDEQMRKRAQQQNEYVRIGS